MLCVGWDCRQAHAACPCTTCRGHGDKALLLRGWYVDVTDIAELTADIRNEESSKDSCCEVNVFGDL